MGSVGRPLSSGPLRVIGRAEQIDSPGPSRRRALSERTTRMVIQAVRTANPTESPGNSVGHRFALRDRVPRRRRVFDGDEPPAITGRFKVLRT